MSNFRPGQSTLEYVIILGAIAAITLISVSVFKVSVKGSAEKMFDTVRGRIISADK